MKTTLDLPDELMRSIKLQAVREDRKLKDLIAELLRRGLAADRDQPQPGRRRVTFPLVLCAHPALPEEEMTPDRIAQILTDADVAETTIR